MRCGKWRVGCAIIRPAALRRERQSQRMPRPPRRGFFERRLPQCGRPLPISCCQRLITPRGNSRASMPTRRQASGHIWSNALSRRNNSLCETSPTSELGHCSAAIFSSASSGAISCFSVIMANPLFRVPFLSGSENKAATRIRLCWPSRKGALLRRYQVTPARIPNLGIEFCGGLMRMP